ncbi:DUF2982 domain-containing protein [Pseudidiomarina sp.]|uniref:DUF2982 domain-containing protein n=1 Tax=Pseudidiomarina sp. TaxID=2081707 RepID=UPI00299E4368|nr:DUF2982 domain-containing protein [Pseudidiomarina sp.]MDX1705302.1 DUF2982 domain-containing protein [Pseudidiomarina sp.]
MTDPAPEVMQKISPAARKHGVGFALLGLLIFAASMFLWLIDAPLPTPAWALLWLVSAGLIFLGWAKVFEPEVSLNITPRQIEYLHHRGSWQLDWDNLVRFDSPRTQKGAETVELPYLAFCVRDIEPILNSISPRLSIHLISEQRHLLTMALRHERPDLHDYSSYFDIPDAFFAPSGTRYTGVQALFAIRCRQLRELLGYELYVPESALDRSLDDFIPWLRELHASRNEHL